MKLKKISLNETELTTKEGVLLFFSYETLVAAASYKNVYVTKNRTSTTSKHITKWYNRNALCATPEVVSQTELDESFNYYNY